MAEKPWITSQEAADILSKKAGREISAAYVRQLAIAGRIRRQQIDARTWQYNRRDTEAYPIRDYGKGSDEESDAGPFAMAV